jgi:flagellar biosynthesis anti-sigma factor FlgM
MHPLVTSSRSGVSIDPVKSARLAADPYADPDQRKTMKINQHPSVTPAALGSASALTGPARRPAAGTPAPEAAVPGHAGAPAARVELSARSRELHQALAAANAAPDVREGVVADVRARISNGTFRIDPDRIARGILDTTA